MATAEQCPAYDVCGYVKWRKERPDKHIKELPEDGDCGKPVELDPLDGRPFIECARLNPHIPLIKVGDMGAQTEDEMKLAFPENYTKNGRPSRLVGGGHK